MMLKTISASNTGWNILFIILSALLISCSEPPNQPLRIASSPWPGYEPLYLARDLKYFDNSKVNLFELPSSDITMESFRNKSTDMATLTLDETLELLQDGTKLRIINIMDISHGGDAVLATPEIKNLADIKGKRVSIVNIPLGLYMLNRLLDKAGLSRNDVTVYPMPESKQAKFFADGKADIVITFEPINTKIIELGGHIIFDSSMIPNEIFDMLIIHENAYLERQAEACEVSRAWFKALKYIDEQHQDAAIRISKRLGIDTKDFDNVMSGIKLPDNHKNRELLGGDQPGLIEPAERLAKIMLNEKQLNKLVNIREAIDPDFTACYTQ